MLKQKYTPLEWLYAKIFGNIRRFFNKKFITNSTSEGVFLKKILNHFEEKDYAQIIEKAALSDLVYKLDKNSMVRKKLEKIPCMQRILLNCDRNLLHVGAD